MKEKSFLKNIKKNPGKSIIFGALALIILICLSVCFWLFVLRPGKPRLSEAPSRNLSIFFALKGDRLPEHPDSDAESVMAFMYDTTVTDAVFKDVFQIDADYSEKIYYSFRMFNANVKNMLKRDEFPSYVVLGIDPYKAFLQSCSNRNTYLDSWSYIMDMAEENPGTPFIIYFPDYGREYWNSMSDTQKSEARLSYILPVRMFSECTNVWFYFHAGYEWVLYSDAIRDTWRGNIIKPEISNHLFNYDVADRQLAYMLTEANVNDVMDSVIEMSGKYDEVTSAYADMSGKKVIFLGDSVFGNFRDETSISSFFAEMTGAKTYNISQGGTEAASLLADTEPYSYAFDYLTKKIDTDTFDREFSSYYSYSSYRLARHDLDISDNDDVYFIVEFGLNEYFSGVSTEVYKENLDAVVKSLKKAYPGAHIMLLSVGFINAFNMGLSINSDVGGALFEYRAPCREVAFQNGCMYLSLSDDFGFSQLDTWKNLLLDGVHYNENGRYMIAKHLAEYFKDSKK